MRIEDPADSSDVRRKEGGEDLQHKHVVKLLLNLKQGNLAK